MLWPAVSKETFARFPGLDYPLYVTFIHLLCRAFHRWWNQEVLFGTTDLWEDLWTIFFSRDSILW